MLGIKSRPRMVKDTSNLLEDVLVRNWRILWLKQKFWCWTRVTYSIEKNGGTSKHIVPSIPIYGFWAWRQLKTLIRYQSITKMIFSNNFWIDNITKIVSNLKIYGVIKTRYIEQDIWTWIFHEGNYNEISRFWTWFNVAIVQHEVNC